MKKYDLAREMGYVNIRQFNDRTEPKLSESARPPQSIANCRTDIPENIATERAVPKHSLGKPNQSSENQKKGKIPNLKFGNAFVISLVKLNFFFSCQSVSVWWIFEFYSVIPRCRGSDTPG
ncbi:unnamed protein product [Parnassius apollo]|uniref:(apollo) hypothetical protein n=1 Tax=Parnassius apollo TaxID=110799 RepID=A0A8S3X617_PARAO|nr:unnamed protein product [Parnassius apollo]